MNKIETNLLARAFSNLEGLNGGEAAQALIQAVIDAAVSEAVNQVAKRLSWDSKFQPLIEASLVKHNDHRKYHSIVVGNCHGVVNGATDSDASVIEDAAEKIAASTLLVFGIRLYATRETK